MLIDLKEQITSITINQEFYIYDKSNMIFTFMDANGEVTVCQLETKADFMRVYSDHVDNFYNVGYTMPEELEKWFEDTFKSIGGNL